MNRGEFISTYIVSEVESPGPQREFNPGTDEDLVVEEIFVPPHSGESPMYYNRGPHGYPRRSTWGSSTIARSRNGGYVDLSYDNTYEYDRQPTRYGREYAVSPPPSSSSSECSLTDCEECDPRGNQRRYYVQEEPKRFISPPQYSGISRSIAHSPATYIRYGRVHYAGNPMHTLTCPPPLAVQPHPRLTASPRDQMVLYQYHYPGRSYTEGSEESSSLSIEDSNVSSPRWSVMNQRFYSGSEGTPSDVQSDSSLTSFSSRNLYECPDPRFAEPRPIMITRSDESGYSKGAGSDGKYSEDEESSSGASGSYYRQERAYSERWH